MIANLVASGVLKRRNIMSNPVALLNLPGGNLDGTDSVSLAPSGAMTSISIRFTYRHGVTPTSSAGVLTSTDSNARGLQLLVNAAQASVRCYMYSGGGSRAWLDIPVLVGKSYDITITGGGDTGANPTITATSNGVTINQGGIIAGISLINVRTIGVGSGTILCKVSYYSEERSGVQQPVYAPSIYGITGTSNCGNGWSLTDGSPATFWANYGQDFMLLTKIGGMFNGIDTCTIAYAIPSGNIRSFDATLLYLSTPATNTTVFSAIDSAGKGLVLKLTSDSKIQIQAYWGDGNRLIQTTTSLFAANTAVNVTAEANFTAKTLAVYVNGSLVTAFSLVAGTTAPDFSVGGAGLTSNVKVSKIVNVVGGVTLPEFNPSTYGVAGTNNCGNGWTLTDGSPATFWT